ncbi:MAG TPA: phage integrase N-terminal SAM-like domain-containing protein [Nitrospira sp.]|nr:phage integrase N-terminal SAM-like domain-containing protein [Nitrospira sp.]
MPSAPIQIRPGEDGQLIVQLPYSPDHVTKIETIVGRRWHQQAKHWTVPQTKDAVTHLLALFAGEPTEVDPVLCPPNGAQHDAPAGVPVVRPTVAGDHPLFDRIHLATRARYLSCHTEQAYCHWIKRFMSFHELQPVADMGEPEIGRFLSSLATA